MQHDRERRADRISGIGWIIFGIIIIVHASMMETREYLGATFLTGPGFVPALIGSAIVILGTVLFVRSLRGETVPYFELNAPNAGRRVLLALVLMLIYGLGLIGTIPFELATFLFVTVFIILFNVPAPNARALTILTLKAAVTGALTAFTVTFVFETVFLVRLP